MCGHDNETLARHQELADVECGRTRTASNRLAIMGKRLAVGLGVALVVVGAVWTVQGLGYLEGSFMTGQKLWTTIGVLCVLAGLVLAIGGLRRR